VGRRELGVSIFPVSCSRKLIPKEKFITIAKSKRRTKNFKKVENLLRLHYTDCLIKDDAEHEVQGKSVL